MLLHRSFDPRIQQNYLILVQLRDADFISKQICPPQPRPPPPPKKGRVEGEGHLVWAERLGIRFGSWVL